MGLLAVFFILGEWQVPARLSRLVTVRYVALCIAIHSATYVQYPTMCSAYMIPG